MTTSNRDKINKAIEWITEAIQMTKWGEVKFVFCIHNGEIRKIEKSITEKIQVPGGDV